MKNIISETKRKCIGEGIADIMNKFREITNSDQLRDVFIGVLPLHPLQRGIYPNDNHDTSTPRHRDTAPQGRLLLHLLINTGNKDFFFCR